MKKLLLICLVLLSGFVISPTIQEAKSTTILGNASVNASTLWGTLGTPVASTSGTSIDFTGIPSGIKRITIMFDGVSTSGADFWLIQLGDAGGFEITGYLGSGSNIASASNSTTGMLLRIGSAAHVVHGHVTLYLVNSATATWALMGGAGYSSSIEVVFSGFTKSLSQELTQVRITTVTGVQTFDAGQINILYE